MKKRNKKYKLKPISIAMIINREIHKNVETLNENMMLLAFRFGHAQKMHFDQLALMANMIEIAHQTKPSDESKVLAENLKSVATKIKARYDKKKKLGISAEEMNTLKWCLSAYDLFWKRQSTNLYNNCVYELKAFYEELDDQKEICMIENGVVGYMTAIREVSSTKILCICICGSEKIVYKKQFERGAYQSCGCKKGQISSDKQKIHGMRKTVEYLAWCNMRRRCEPDYEHSKDYFDRGITVCDRWLDSFENFYSDMGKRPSQKHSLDRINNNGNYEPTNCRWANKNVQAFNKREESANASGYKGVYFDKSMNKWRVRIAVKGIPLIDKFFVEKNNAILFRKYFVDNFSDLYGDDVGEERFNSCVAEVKEFYAELEEERAA